MEILPYTAHTPAFRDSLAQSALPDAPVVPDRVRTPHWAWVRSARAALSEALHRAAEAVAPSRPVRCNTG